MQPIVDGIEKEYDGKIAFDKVDANVEPGRTMLRSYGLRGHPSYAIVDPKGNLLWSTPGILSEDALKESINRFLQ